MQNLKKATILLVVLSSCLSFGLTGQSNFNQRITVDQSLTGTVHILSLFVETDESSWEEDEQDYFYNQLQESQYWLEQEASRYGHDLVFDNDHFSMENLETIWIDDVTRFNRPSETIEKVMEQLVYDDVDDFLDFYGMNLREDKFKILLFVKSADRSHAWNQWSTSDVDLAVVYCQSTVGRLTNHFVISHEVLHQFGAWDMYYGKSQTEASAQRAKELFPNSVMINTWTNHASLEVDELTAWRIGWGEYQEEFSDFNPQINRVKKQNEIRIKPRGQGLRFKIGGDRSGKDGG